MLTTGLELGNICRELLDHRQVLGQRRQTHVRRFMDVRCRGRAAGDQGRVDPIILGMLQHELGVSTNLHRLEDDDVKAGCPQGGNHRLFVTPARLDTDSLNSTPPQRADKAGWLSALYRSQPFALLSPLGPACVAGIAAAHTMLSLLIFFDFLVMRTLGSFNHPGPMKSRSRSCSATALVARERAIDDRRPFRTGTNTRNRRERTTVGRAALTMSNSAVLFVPAAHLCAWVLSFFASTPTRGGRSADRRTCVCCRVCETRRIRASEARRVP